jgi:sigma-B regulation protein RsbU (phosphoserine phosphatase)
VAETSEQGAAGFQCSTPQEIQQTLIPQKLEELRGYDVEKFYKPFQDVSGDYFDMIELPGNRMLFAIADVSGKGMPAALLAVSGT